ncbi:MAG TPA: hypothetical protein VN672_09230 [Solirubrobacteraceae bacterium]|nr:hypothetical protein [Solirubrobacteraceae bacterium]
MDPNAFHTPDWVGIVVGTVGVLVSGIGLTIAVVQLRKLKRTADEVREAVHRQREEISGALTLARTGDLERIETDLRNASAAAEPAARPLAIQAALSWRRAGGDLQGIVVATTEVSSELVEAMGESLALVDVALHDLADPGIAVQDACRSLLGKMSIACSKAREASGAMILPEP